MPQSFAGVMHEFKHRQLHSGKRGPIVKSRKQAMAIAESEQRQMKGGKKKKSSVASKPLPLVAAMQKARAHTALKNAEGAIKDPMSTPQPKAYGSGPFSAAEIKQGYKVEYTSSELAKLDYENDPEYRKTMASRISPKGRGKCE